jgi:integrase
LATTSGLHVVAKRLADGRARFYVYAWRGGPLIHTQDRHRPRITPELLAKADRAKGRVTRDNIDRIIDLYRQSPEFAAKAPKTQEDYRQRLDQCSAQFGRVPTRLIPELGPEVVKWRDSMAATPRAADRCVGMLHTVLRWGKQRGHWRGENPAADIGKLHKVNRADLIWEPRHWEAVAGVPGYIRRTLTLGALTGLRIGDLLSLRWEDARDGYLLVNTRKTRTEAIIPLHHDLDRFLTGPGRGAILRTSYGEPWTVDGWQSSWRTARPAGFDRKVHDLRGTFATRLMVAGFSDTEIAVVMGWRAERVAMIRARYVDRGRVARAMAERLAVNREVNQSAGMVPTEGFEPPTP